MTQGIYAELINTEYTNNIVDFVKARGKLYKVKITTNIENAIVKMDDEIKNFGMYADKKTINYEASADGYQTKTGSITVEKADITETITLEPTSQNGKNKINHDEDLEA